MTSSGGQSAGVMAVAVFDDDGPGPHRPALYAAGYFQFVSGIPANNIARWDGTSWSAVGSGLANGQFPPNVFSMASFDDGSGPALYVSGLIRTAGGITCNGIARWNGTAWSTFGNSSSAIAYDMRAFDDGSGPALWLAGSGGYADPSPLALGVAKWNGTAWFIPPGATSSTFNSRALAVYDDGSGPGLYIGGSFTTAGGIPANRIVRYGLPQCPANCDGSRNASLCPTLSVNDFLCFLDRFAAGDQRANCDASTLAPTLNVLDFICFLNAFASGCP